MTFRLTLAITDDLRGFIDATATAWMDPINGFVKRNSYGIEILVAQRPGSDFNGAAVYNFGATIPDMPHNTVWYQENAHGKNLAALATGLDSHEAVRLYQGALWHVEEGVFPWGGAVIDKHYGICIGVSGFKEDEDILFARTIRNYLVMLLDREGEAILDEARERGKLWMPRPDSSLVDDYRFTR
jgi:hypothetical protein